MESMRMITESLRKYAPDCGISITPEMVEQFELYADMLLEWNQKMNLTAITAPEEIAVKHFLDSLLLLKATEIEQASSLIDIGTGAGFPGIPLKIARPDLKLTLLDSLNKRIGFLSEVSDKLGQENQIIHGRAEQYGHDSEMREQFDFAVARAVAALPALCEYCLPFVKPGGIFVAFKGPDVEREAEDIDGILDVLGAQFLEIKNYVLPPDNKRAIVLIKKVSQIPAKYPRKAVKITKSPLR